MACLEGLPSHINCHRWWRCAFLGLFSAKGPEQFADIELTMN